MAFEQVFDSDEIRGTPGKWLTSLTISPRTSLIDAIRCAYRDRLHVELAVVIETVPRIPGQLRLVASRLLGRHMVHFQHHAP